MSNQSNLPELPQPAHPNLDSMLLRKFGREVANYFSGSTLNRVSFLRTDNAFLSAAVTHASTSFLLFNNLAPLGHGPFKLAYTSYTDVRPLIGDNPYAKPDEKLIIDYNSSTTAPQLVFLGLDEKTTEPSPLEWTKYKGAPFFALDVTPKGTTAPAASDLITTVKQRGLQFIEGRLNNSLPAAEAAIFSHGKTLIDWNARNPFCAQCGQPTLSVNGGSKRTCPPKDFNLAGAQATVDATPTSPHDRPPCTTRSTLSNLAFPRTDPTIIVAVVSSAGTHILLGRQARWPPNWYSTLAGFVEPAESVEDAIRREVWEEAGVELGRVVLHSTQPWPFPANLMIGAVAQTVPHGEEIRLDHDAELHDARWVPIDEVAHALDVGTSGIGEQAGKGYVEGMLRLPPRTAISNRLLTAVVEGFLGGEKGKI
ncbi:MAG: hypothetical protein M1825_005798 [Sarcosagium campestre]|nr:MAG: hypothetical protein M1825_005798 [Sarcosagium campestre]